ncbi:unnamed protein product [Mesocestoides corti]|uniref:Autophagy-related protein n=1 Tax=Mesocestoides corti TaxID=53468 RepID=A0A158QTW5_MESCO|nr:unnamed protein product [Mesocestoides corti]
MNEYEVIVERHPGSQINDLDKHKFLVPSEITVAQFMWIIRKRLELSPEKALFLFFDDLVPQASLTIGQLYNERKSDDGFLYAHYSGENSFGVTSANPGQVKFYQTCIIRQNLCLCVNTGFRGHKERRRRSVEKCIGLAADVVGFDNIVKLLKEEFSLNVGVFSP